jgi:hypothetical protein
VVLDVLYHITDENEHARKIHARFFMLTRGSESP